MAKINILIMRIILGAVFAVVLTRIFHPEFSIVWVVSFAAMMISLAYLLEYWRKKKNKSDLQEK